MKRTGQGDMVKANSANVQESAPSGVSIKTPLPFWPDQALAIFTTMAGLNGSDRFWPWEWVKTAT